MKTEKKSTKQKRGLWFDFVLSVYRLLFKTEYLSGVQVAVSGQCAVQQQETIVVVPGAYHPHGGGEAGGTVPGVTTATAPAPVASSGVGSAANTAAAMNQLGTVYATKRRRRNGKRFVPFLFFIFNTNCFRVRNNTGLCYNCIVKNMYWCKLNISWNKWMQKIVIVLVIHE